MNLHSHHAATPVGPLSGFGHGPAAYLVNCLCCDHERELTRPEEIYLQPTFFFVCCELPLGYPSQHIPFARLEVELVNNTACNRLLRVRLWTTVS